MISHLNKNFDTLIFTGGKHPQPTLWLPLITPQTLIIAADSGLRQLTTTEIIPAHIIGDFDSLNNADEVLKQYPQAKIHRYNKEKDETDTELALLLAQQLGSKEILLIGGGEGRLDHLLAIIQLFKGPLSPSAWLSAQELILPIQAHQPLTLTNIQGRTLSIFPLISPTTAIITQGLAWSFEDFENLLSQMSLSNIAKDSTISITINDGLLLFILPNVEAL